MLDNYERLPNGVIRQKHVQKITYDYDYSNRYNSYGEKGMYLSYLRLGVLIGQLGHYPTSLVDVGYGNGDFLRACKSSVPRLYGCDISDYPVPEGATKITLTDISNVEVVCFFDSLEHFEDLSFVKDLDTEYIFISVPWCHYVSDTWFASWYHRRENEHLFHFNDISLKQFFAEAGYDCVYLGCFEDTIRVNPRVAPLLNILSGLFRKISKPA